MPTGVNVFGFRVDCIVVCYRAANLIYVVGHALEPLPGATDP
jgi:hypothetical protein